MSSYPSQGKPQPKLGRPCDLADSPEYRGRYRHEFWYWKVESRWSVDPCWLTVSLPSFSAIRSSFVTVHRYWADLEAHIPMASTWTFSCTGAWMIGTSCAAFHLDEDSPNWWLVESCEAPLWSWCSVHRYHFAFVHTSLAQRAPRGFWSCLRQEFEWSGPRIVHAWKLGKSGRMDIGAARIGFACEDAQGKVK